MKTTEVGTPWIIVNRNSGVIMDKDGKIVAVCDGPSPAVRRVYAERVVEAVNAYWGEK